MLGEIFKAILITSLAGSALAALITLLKPLTKRVFGYSWHYYIWLAVLIVMILPVRFTLPQSSADVPAMNMQTAQTSQITVQTDIADTTQTVNTTITTAQKATDFINMIIVNRMNYLAVIWLLGIAVLLIINVGGYARLIAKIHRNSVVISCPEVKNYTGRKITARIGKELSSPFMLGAFRPTLVLPDTELDETQLNNILRHEMTHFRRKDILYKWFAVIVKCIHWFNPVIYYAVRQINTECEISCDLSVVSGMNDNERISYVNTILSLVSGKRVKRVPLTTQMASGKTALKRRFTMIKNVKRTSKFMSTLSAVTAVVMLGTTVFASGVLSDLTTDNYTVEVTNKGEKISLANKPFVENGEVYVPLRETIEQLGFDESNSYIGWQDGGKIKVAISQSNGISGMYGLEIGSSGIDLKHIDIGGNENDFTVTVKENLDVDIVAAVGGGSFDDAPILKNSVTYIPIENLNYMLYGFLDVRDENNNLCELNYSILDKDGKDIRFEFMNAQTEPLSDEEALKIAPNYANEQMMCYDVIENFYRECSAGNVKTALMNYSTESFNNPQREDYDIFNARLGSVHSIYLYPNGTYHVRHSLDYSDGNEQEFETVFKRQPDGRFLIDGMWTVFDEIETESASAASEEVTWEIEPEIFADPYSDFLTSNISAALGFLTSNISESERENGLDGTYSYEYIRHWYNDSNDKVDFYYSIKPFGEDETKTLILNFEKKGNDWVRYGSEISDGTI